MASEEASIRRTFVMSLALPYGHQSCYPPVMITAPSPRSSFCYSTTRCSFVCAVVLVLLRCIVCVESGDEKGKAPEPSRDTWVISGQSNACGRGMMPGPSPDPHLRAFDHKTGDWVVASDPLPGLATSGVGPWVFSANEVVQGKEIAVDMSLIGIGGHVIGFWNEKEWLGKGLVKLIERSAKGAGVFLFYQGESDAGHTTEFYFNALVDLARRVRAAAENPKMWVVIVQVAACGNADLTTVREGQRLFVKQDDRAVLVPALGRSMGDNCHLDKVGHESLGKEIGKALLKRRYGATDSEIDWPGPVMDRAVLRSGEDGNEIVVHFAEVQELQNAEDADFVVITGEKDEKKLLCTVLETGKTILRLAVAEPVLLPAKLVYGGRAFPGSALRDKAGNRAPAVVMDLEPATSKTQNPKDEPSAAPNGA